MAGDPLAQAVRVVSALVDSLGDEDSLELLEFSDAPRRWRKSAARTTSRVRSSAKAWLAGLRASGSTEMRDALSEALAGIRPGAQRQVLLVTDGQIGFEREIVAEVLERLPQASRLHTLGVGSAPNRSLLGPAARAGRGTESIVGVDEDVDRAVRTLVARTAAPLVTDLSVEGDALLAHAPARLPDLFAGAPALVSLRLRPEGGTLRVRGLGAERPFDRTISVPVASPGVGSAAVAALFGRESVEDHEMSLAGGADRGEMDAAIERLGLAHQLATRLTSWVAVSEEPHVDPTQPTRRERVPHALPHGVSVEGLGLRSGSSQRTRFLLSEASDLMAGVSKEAPEGMVHAKRSMATLHADEGDSFEDLARRPRLFAVRRITLDRPGKLVLELSLWLPIAWAPPAEVTLHLADGSTLAARVVPERSTAAGEVGRGDVLRLALLHEGPALGAALVRLAFEHDGETVVIDVPRGRRHAGLRGRR